MATDPLPNFFEFVLLCTLAIILAESYFKRACTSNGGMKKINSRKQNYELRHQIFEKEMYGTIGSLAKCFQLPLYFQVAR